MGWEKSCLGTEGREGGKEEGGCREGTARSSGFVSFFSLGFTDDDNQFDRLFQLSLSWKRLRARGVEMDSEEQRSSNVVSSSSWFFVDEITRQEFPSSGREERKLELKKWK